MDLSYSVDFFISGEHERIGDAIRLPKPGGSGGSSAQRPLTLPNGLQLSYGQIIALAGDFYGVPEEPIVDPTEKPSERVSGRSKRFMAAYSTLAHDHVKEEVNEILEIMTEEKSEIEDELVERWDKVTGGKWIFGVPVVFGRVMKLAQNNYDHFMPSAKDAYLIGHQIALEKAKSASKARTLKQQTKMLDEAYSVDAFACHFLTDSFSSGHLRTPRRELSRQVTPSLVGDYLCKYMHDEDNKYGLNVTNKRGEKWIAYGDGWLSDEQSRANYQMAVAAVQASVNHIFEAFEKPHETSSSDRVTDYIPFVDPNARNNSPMFQVKDGILVRRTDLENLRDFTTTSNWFGIETVLKVRSYNPHGSVTGE